MFARLWGKTAWFTSESTDQAETVPASLVPGRSFSNLSVSADPGLLRRRGAVRRAVNPIYALRQIAEWQEADAKTDAEILSGGSSEPIELIRSLSKGDSSSAFQQISSPPSTSSEGAVHSVGGLDSDTSYSQGDNTSPSLCVVDVRGAESVAPCQAFSPMALDPGPARDSTEMVKGTGPRWSVDDLTYLPETLRHLLRSGHTACEIGMAVETILYRRDDFLMDGRITALIDARATYAEIGQTVLKYVKLQNGDASLVRLQAKPGNTSMRPQPASLRPKQVIRRKPTPQEAADQTAFRELRSRAQSDVPEQKANNGQKKPVEQSDAETIRWPFLGRSPPFKYEDPNYQAPIICSRPQKPRPTVRFLDDIQRLETWTQTGTCVEREYLKYLKIKQLKVQRVTEADIWEVPKDILDLEAHEVEFVGFSEICPAAFDTQGNTDWYGEVEDEDPHDAPSTPGSSRTLV